MRQFLTLHQYLLLQISYHIQVHYHRFFRHYHNDIVSAKQKKQPDAENKSSNHIIICGDNSPCG